MTDYDNDGWLDLFVSNYFDGEEQGADFLFHNESDGTFVNRAAEAGIARPQRTFAGVFGDVDNDGWADLFVGGGDQAPDVLYRNNGGSTFTDITEAAGIAPPSEANFVIALFLDYNNNGRLDLFLPMRNDHLNQLYRNEGDGTFTEVAVAAGVDAQELSITPGNSIRGFGATSGDLDNDGWLDLVVPHRAEDKAVDYLFRNRGDGTFADITAEVGPIGNGEDLYARVGDYDGDGFLDLFINNNLPNGREKVLFRNRGNDNHWLHIELVGIESNRSALGTQVRVEAGELSMMRQVGRSETLVVEFGLGANARADRVEVRWPSGRVTQLSDIPGDQVIRLIEDRDAVYTTQPTTLWVSLDTVQVDAPVDLHASVQPTLFEPDAQIIGVTADLSALGGREGVPMIGAGDGTYHLQADLQAPDHSGRQSLFFRVEQMTSLGIYPTTLIHSIAAITAEDVVVFDDALPAQWSIDTGRRLTMDPAVSMPVFQGAAALGLQGLGGVWQMDYRLSQPISPVGYNTLQFAFHPGDVSLERAFLLLELIGVPRTGNNSIDLLKGGLVDLEVADWQTVAIDIGEFYGSDIGLIRFSSNLEGAFYLDDIRLVADLLPPRVTAVSEEHQESVPQAFDLEQNYPNSFNSDTVIRYTLPQTEHVVLSVYNLAGQQVARLVEDQRPAGVSTVRWDGTDTDGHNLASGAYLYRLQVRSKVETRKLLLLR